MRKRAYDLIFGSSRTQFPDERHSGGDRGNQCFEIDHPAEWYLMIQIWKNNIMNVAPDQMRRHFPEPLGMIDKRQIVSNLCMPEIVPVTYRSDLGKEPAELSLGGACLDSDAILDSEYNAG